MRDLFGHEPAITWDERGMKGQARDGRAIEISISVLTSRFVAAIPVHGRDVMTRRSRKTAEEARAAAERAIEESAQC